MIGDALIATHQEDTSQPNKKLFDICVNCEMCIGDRGYIITDVGHRKVIWKSFISDYWETWDQVGGYRLPLSNLPPAILKWHWQISVQVLTGAWSDLAPMLSGRGSLSLSTVMPCSHSSAASPLFSPQSNGTLKDGFVLVLDSLRLRFWYSGETGVSGRERAYSSSKNSAELLQPTSTLKECFATIHSYSGKSSLVTWYNCISWPWQEACPNDFWTIVEYVKHPLLSHSF